MKKIFLILTLALVALAGCKKDPAPGQEPGTEQEPGTGQDTPTTIVFKTSKAVGETITLGFRRSEMQNISMDGAKPESGLPAGDWGIYTCKLSSQTVTIKGDITLFDCKNSGITDIALTKDLRLYDFNCSGNELTSLDVSGLTELVYFACSSNRLTSLNIEGCDKLCYVECYSNSIKGEAMTDIVNDLPKLDTPGAGRLVVTAEGCGNVITAANVATAKGKNWDVVDDKYHEFEGHIAVTGVSLDTEGVEINTKATTTVKALIEPANATNKNVTWTIGNPEIATVNDGVVTGVAEGETTLTVTTVDGGFTASIPVKVVYSPVESLLGEWEGEEYSIKISKLGSGDNKINIRGFPQNGVDLTAYVTDYNTIRIPKQYYFDRSEWDGETVVFQIDFIPLNEEETVVFDSDHIYISDSWELGYYILERYVTNRGKADTLIRKQ